MTNMSMKFTDLPLIAPLQFALKEAKYENPTPIQEAAIPIILEGKDLLGIAQTGTGKTAAFCLPLLQNLSKDNKRPEPKAVRALILTPTRELAIQIADNIKTYSKHLRLSSTVIFGGVGQTPQVKALAPGVDILVATPGRLLDLYQQNMLRLARVETFILDEADRMLDMGFMQDVKKILPLLPKKRHNLFFSATMPKEIRDLAHSILVNPEKVEVTPAATTAEKIHQQVMFVEKSKKIDLLIHLMGQPGFDKVLVFSAMKHGANRVTEKLIKAGIKAAAIHSDKSQNARQRALEEFKSGAVQVLVATDIAARGIDIDEISHVINMELPHIPETYVHRIGRTARAGKAGISVSLCMGEERSFVFAIEKTTGTKMEIITDQPFHSKEAAETPIISVGKAKAQLEAQRMENKSRTQKPRSYKPSNKGGSGMGGKHGAKSGQKQDSKQSVAKGKKDHLKSKPWNKKKR